MVVCENPFPCVTCDGSMSCDDLYFAVEETMMYWDTNSDGYINGELDDNDVEMYLSYVASCDLDHDGTINKCEVMDCIV
jgi:hypothetical protein